MDLWKICQVDKTKCFQVAIFVFGDMCIKTIRGLKGDLIELHEIGSQL